MKKPIQSHMSMSGMRWMGACLAWIKHTGASRRFRAAGSLLPLLGLLLFSLAACAPSTGIFSGGNWQVGALRNEHLQVLAVDPNHLQNIYAGDARDGIFVSTDTGVTWRGSSTGLPLPLAINALSFDIPGKKLFAATSAGLFVSSDSARSWSQVVQTPADSYTALTFDANSPQVIYAATAHSGILKSSDEGASWTRIDTGLPTGELTNLLYDPNLKQLWAVFGDTLYRSDDNGASWRALNNGLPPGVGVNALALGAVTSSQGGLLYLGTNHGFFRSTDAGQHWAQSEFSLANLQVRDVLIDATQPNVVYVSTTLGVLRSNDNGQTWNQVATGLPSGQAYAGLVQAGAGYAQLLVVAGGIYLYPGSGGSFDASRIIPVVLILLFFLVLYYFFSMRRRRMPRRRAPVHVDETSAPGIPPAGNVQNGRVPAPDSTSSTPTDEKRRD